MSPSSTPGRGAGTGLWGACAARAREGARMLRTGIGLTLMTNAAITLCGIATGVMSARLLGPSGEGTVAAAALWPTALIFLGSCAGNDALIYASGRSPEASAEIATAAAVLGLAQCAAIALIGVKIIGFALARQGPAVVGLSVGYFLLILPVNLLGYSVSILQGQMRFESWNRLRLGTSLLLLAALAGLKAAGAFTPAAVLYAGIAGPLLMNATAAWLVARGAGFRWRWDPAVAKSLALYGLGAAGSNALQYAKENADHILISVTLAAAGMGVYAVAAASASVIAPLMSAFESVVFPRTAAGGATADSRAVMVREVRRGLWSGLIALAALELGLPLAIHLVYGRAYDASAAPARLLAAAFFLRGLGRVVTSGARGLGLPRLSLPADLLALAASAVLLVALVPRFGLSGAAWAIGLSSALSLALLLRLCGAQAGVSPSELLRTPFSA